MAKRQNLFTYSEQLDNAAWGKSNLTVTANATTAPDGTATAEAIVESTSTNVLHQLYQSPASLPANGIVYTGSIYLKAGARNYAILLANVPSCGINVDLVTGVVTKNGVVAKVLDFGSQDAGNGWWRVWFTVAQENGGVMFIVQPQLLALQIANTTYTGVAGTTAIYAWGGQIVLANHPGPYTPTTTVAVNTGNIRNIAQKKQNLLAYSQALDNAFWSKPSATITTGQADPFGGTAACKVSETADLAYHQVYRAYTPTRQFFTVSAWMKAGTNRYGVIATQGAWFAIFDLQTGLITNVTGLGGTANIEAFAGGWYRCSFTVDRALGGTVAFAIVATSSVGTNFVSYLGNVANNLYVYGVQATDSNNAGPYVATLGTAYDTGSIRNIAQKKQNLQTYSETFQNAAWTKTGLTATDNFILAPNGTMTGTKITDSATAIKIINTLGFSVAAPFPVCVFSFFAKAGTKSWLTVYPNSAAGGRVNFDLSTGLFGTRSGAEILDQQMWDVGGGWYRCSVMFTILASGYNERIYMSNGNDAISYVGDGTGTFYIWGGQIVIGSNHPGPYAQTTASVVNTGGTR